MKLSKFITSVRKNAVISNTLEGINGCEKSSCTGDVRFLPAVEMTEEPAFGEGWQSSVISLQ